MKSVYCPINNDACHLSYCVRMELCKYAPLRTEAEPCYNSTEDPRGTCDSDTKGAKQA